MAYLIINGLHIASTIISIRRHSEKYLSFSRGIVARMQENEEKGNPPFNLELEIGRHFHRSVLIDIANVLESFSSFVRPTSRDRARVKG